LAPTKNSS